MKILQLHPEIVAYLKKRNLVAKLEKQRRLFEGNPFHPGLNTELTEPRIMKVWSFRVDRKYRAIFIFRDGESIEILDVNLHYK